VAFPDLPKRAGEIDKDAPKTFTETASGLKYRILRKGEGDAPRATDEVVVDYQGWLDDDKIFDSSYQRGEPASFPLNAVVAGWTEGLQLVKTGGMIELVIPPELAYGNRGRPGIPPNSTLNFLVELLEVK
jgi:FKBP-type peptidyl-prolyl cis-trans isomerase FkpA